MASEDERGVLEALAFEEADAWFEYLETVRADAPSRGYDEVEPWAWARLAQRLKAVETARAHRGRAAA